MKPQPAPTPSWPIDDHWLDEFDALLPIATSTTPTLLQDNGHASHHPPKVVAPPTIVKGSEVESSQILKTGDRRRAYRMKKRRELLELRGESAELMVQLQELLQHRKALSTGEKRISGWRGVALRQLQRRLEADTLNRELRTYMRSSHEVAVGLLETLRLQMEATRSKQTVELTNERPPKPVMQLSETDVWDMALMLCDLDDMCAQVPAKIKQTRMPLMETSDAYNSRCTRHVNREDGISSTTFAEMLIVPFPVADVISAMDKAFPIMISDECVPIISEMEQGGAFEVAKFVCGQFEVLSVSKTIEDCRHANSAWRSVIRERGKTFGPVIAEFGYGHAEANRESASSTCIQFLSHWKAEQLHPLEPSAAVPYVDLLDRFTQMYIGTSERDAVELAEALENVIIDDMVVRKALPVQPDNQLEVVQEAGAINRGINALIKENLDTSFNGHSINSYGLEAALMHRLQIYSKWLVVGAAKKWSQTSDTDLIPESDIHCLASTQLSMESAPLSPSQWPLCEQWLQDLDFLLPIDTSSSSASFQAIPQPPAPSSAPAKSQISTTSEESDTIDRRRKYQQKRRRELLELREDAAELEEQLCSFFRRRKPIMTTANGEKRLVSGWQGIAFRQLQRRLKAEALNRELKTHIRSRHEIALGLIETLRAQMKAGASRTLGLTSEKRFKPVMELSERDVWDMAQMVQDIDDMCAQTSSRIEQAQMPRVEDESKTYNSRFLRDVAGIDGEQVAMFAVTQVMPFHVADAIPANDQAYHIMISDECVPVISKADDGSRAVKLMWGPFEILSVSKEIRDRERSETGWRSIIREREQVWGPTIRGYGWSTTEAANDSASTTRFHFLSHWRAEYHQLNEAQAVIVPLADPFERYLEMQVETSESDADNHMQLIENVIVDEFVKRKQGTVNVC